MSCGASWHSTSCHVGQVSKGRVGIGPIDLGQIVRTPYLLSAHFLSADLTQGKLFDKVDVVSGLLSVNFMVSNFAGN